MSLFVDTSVFYAGVDASDVGHERAKVILSTRELLITTDHVLAETWRLLRQRVGRPVAERFWANIRAGTADLELVQAQDLDLAWEIGRVYTDQDFSFVDRTTFAVMQRIGVDRVATYDRAFAIFRYGARRDQAFEIVA